MEIDKIFIHAGIDDQKEIEEHLEKLEQAGFIRLEYYVRCKVCGHDKMTVLNKIEYFYSQCDNYRCNVTQKNKPGEVVKKAYFMYLLIKSAMEGVDLSEKNFPVRQISTEPVSVIPIHLANAVYREYFHQQRKGKNHNISSIDQIRLLGGFTIIEILQLLYSGIAERDRIIKELQKQNE